MMSPAMTLNRSKRMKPPEILGMSALILFLIGVSIAFLVPFVYVISISFSSELALADYGVTLFPKEFSTEAYKFLFNFATPLLRSYGNTIIIAACSTVLMIIFCSMFAYPISKKDLPGRTGIMMYVLFTMLFGGGLIPTYLSMRAYGFYGNWLALILPATFSAWNVILLRNYFNTLPASLEESAFIDGAGYGTILFRIVIPLSKPILATLSLFCIVGTWNNWYSALLYLSREPKLWPIMMFLKNVLEAVNPATTMGMPSGSAFPPTECLKMAVVVVCTAPILLSYPWLQKYFVKGMLIGSIKG